MWLDKYGNTHNLDYVLEREGTPNRIGTPVAFIESAWRRYTKHSRNKAQEIQGAVLPIADKYHFSAPFLGCFLVGVYTSGAKEQLASCGFHVLYFPYSTVIEAFSSVGVEAAFDERTSEREFKRKQQQWRRVPQAKKELVWAKLRELNEPAVQDFLSKLESAVDRQIRTVRIIPLHGTAVDCNSIQEAIEFVAGYGEQGGGGPVVKYEIQIRYENGDKIDAQFQDKQSTIGFLEAFTGGNWTSAAEELNNEVE